MDVTSPLEMARAVRSAQAAERQYVFSWRGGGQSTLVGAQAVAEALGLRLQSVRSYLATGKGRFSLERTNPTTGETDILTVAAVPVPAKPKLKRGRPRTRPLTEAEYNARRDLA